MFLPRVVRRSCFLLLLFVYLIVVIVHREAERSAWPQARFSCGHSIMKRAMHTLYLAGSDVNEQANQDTT